MKKRRLLTCLLLLSTLCVGAFASAKNGPLLWKVEGAIHAPDPRVTTLPKSVKNAFSAAKIIATELELDATTIMAMANASMLPVGQTLSNDLPVELQTKLEAELRYISPQLSLAMFDRMKIWALATNLQLLPMTLKYPGVPSLDIKLAQEAQKAGKKNIGIETLDEQLRIFDGLSKADQIALMSETVNQTKANREAGINLLETMLTAYINGDAQKILKLTNEGFDPKHPLAQKLKKQLIDDRNKVMADRIHDMTIKNGHQVHFFAVGAAHLVGEGSIIELLQKKGLTITRVTEN